MKSSKLPLINKQYEAKSTQLQLKWGSPTTHNAVPEFRIQESEFRKVVSASRTDLIFLFFTAVVPQ
jgi:hypothetical protein